MKVTLSAAMAASRQMMVLYVFALRDLYYKSMEMSALVWMDDDVLTVYIYMFKVIYHWFVEFPLISESILQDARHQTEGVAASYALLSH